MDTALNLILSAIEFFAAFVLMLTLFRIQLEGYFPHMIFSSILLSLISYLFYNVFHIQPYAPILQSLIYIGFFWLMFRIHVFYAAIISTMGYLTFTFLQILLVVVFQWTGLGTLQDIMGFHAVTYLFQLAASIIVILLCCFLYKYRLGFSFVPDDERQRINLQGTNAKLLFTVFFAGVIIAFYYFSSMHGFSAFVLISFILVLVVLFMIMLALRKEIET